MVVGFTIAFYSLPLASANGLMGLMVKIKKTLETTGIFN
jgi:hypothetical protein